MHAKQDTAVTRLNRLLKIEASLDKVRVVSMRMKKRADMLAVCKTISKQLERLGVKEIRNVQTAIFYPERGTYMNYEYYAKHDKTFITDTSYTNHRIAKTFATKMLKGKGEYMVKHIKGEKVKEWLAYQKTTNVFIDNFLKKAASLNYYWFSLGPVALGISTYAPLSAGDIDLFKKFLNVFELAYTRYLDIEKAEAQAREVQIQLALEKVRARTMAMQRSEELSDAVYVLFQQFKELGESPDQATIGIINEEEHVIEYWVTMYGKSINKVFKFSIDEPNVTNKIYKAWKENKKSLVIDLKGTALKQFMTYRAGKGGAAINTDEKRRIINVAFFSKGLLNVQSKEERSQESILLLERFAKVFEQTYTRFLDLQKAEAQARESQIQLALERVRARTMAMQHSNELADTATILFSQFRNLGYEPGRITIGIMQEEKQKLELWATSGEANEQQFFELPFGEPHVLAKCIKAWKEQKKSLVLDVSGQPLKEYTEFWRRFGASQDHQSKVDRVIFNFAFFSKGYLGFISFEQVPSQTIELLERFAGVFDLTYTRFLDLEKAEAQAREAQIEAALERVRSRTLAMQRSDELAETSAVLFQQLIYLGISPNRLYISIMKDDDGNTEFWITDEDGSKISKAYEDNLNNNTSFNKMYNGWKQQKRSLVIDMKGKELQKYFHHLNEELHVPFKGGLTQKRRFQYIAYFSKGFIGMASPDEQPEETLQLLERFAYVFNLTFTRFNDLQIAEAHALQAEQDLIEIKAARKNAEDALSELQVTQRQLIQSEKMASLGELTAGIAHEIQNPLNFVNNFSEVNKEMLEELKAERLKPNADKALEDDLINDLIDNSEKINHHGKRADAIVKGMLQHSRTSSGKKEPTDINALCDEYLRLAYHGLRAKDKSFNADFASDFDSSIGKIEVTPQDIGRVVLNIISNAFYAVNEKAKQKIIGYKPSVVVETRKTNGTAEIIIKDNGCGMPDAVTEKIFQPFFTTKPTGSGTGLGLSLAYDIIKAHNGEIKVETKEGVGTKFIIVLPT